MKIGRYEFYQILKESGSGYIDSYSTDAEMAFFWIYNTSLKLASKEQLKLFNQHCRNCDRFYNVCSDVKFKYYVENEINRIGMFNRYALTGGDFLDFYDKFKKLDFFSFGYEKSGSRTAAITKNHTDRQEAFNELNKWKDIEIDIFHINCDDFEYYFTKLPTEMQSKIKRIVKEHNFNIYTLNYNDRQILKNIIESEKINITETIITEDNETIRSIKENLEGTRSNLKKYKELYKQEKPNQIKGQGLTDKMCDIMTSIRWAKEDIKMHEETLRNFI